MDNTTDKTVSYSQFSMWTECPYRWYLNYVKKHRIKSENISSLFGTSMHEVLQQFLQTMYSDSIVTAEEIDLPKLLMERMMDNFNLAKTEGYEMNITKESMVDFFDDGVAILDWFVKHRNEYFSKRNFELVGVEVPLSYPIRKGINFSAYLDIVIKDTVLNRYKIFDIKTSMQGWNKYQKKDKRKLMQLILYKVFYAMQFNVDPKDIDVSFIIVKRKLFENVEFPQKRIQRIEPADGTVTQHETLRQLHVFINSVFDADGNYREDVEHPKYPSPKACKYCEFSNRPDLCDKNKGNKPPRRKSEKQKK